MNALGLGSIAFNAAANIFAVNQQRRQAVAQYQSLAGAFAQDVDAFKARGAQIRRRSVDQAGIRSVQATRQLGQIAAALSSAGIGGVTAARLMNEAAFNRDTDLATLRQSTVDEIEQEGRALTGSQSSYINRMHQIARPSAIGAGMNAGIRAFDLFRSSGFGSTAARGSAGGGWVSGSDLP